MRAPTLLVCGIGSGMERSLKTVRDLGYTVVVVTDRPDELAVLTADRIINAYPRDPTQVVSAVRAERLRDVAGVLSLGYENPPVISQLAKLFGTPGLSVETALDCTNKRRRIDLLARNHVRVPRHRNAWDVPSTLNALEEIGRPAVIKPVDLTSSLGVAHIGTAAADARISQLVNHAIKLSPSRQLLVEEYLEGTEHTIEGVRDRQTIYITGVSDRNYAEKRRFAPFFFENGDTLPSALPSKAISDCVAQCVRAATALELDPAVFSCDVLRTHQGEVVILEVAARMAGSRFGTEIVPLSTGVNVLPSAVRLAVGEGIQNNEVTPDGERPVVLRYLVVGPGTVTRVAELPDPNSLGVYDLFWENRPRVGDALHRFSSSKDVIAGVIATAPTPAEAKNLAATALDAITLDVETSRSLSGVKWLP